MRNLNRNKRLIYYANRQSEVITMDEWGNETGEPTPLYGATTPLLCNVSAASGGEEMSAFGSFTNYSRVLCVADNNCPIDESSIIWFGVEPPKPHNYIVVRKADSKNGVLYALLEVTVT